MDPLEAAVYVFLGIIFIAFVFLLAKGDTEEKAIQKVIGGLSVFVLAIIAKHWFIFFTSLFIGGLIIASERFMQSLAAILRSDSRQIPNTLAALNKSVDITAASEEEVAIEKKGENKLEETEQNSSKNRQNERIAYDERDRIREKILSILSKKYGTHFTPNLKLENEYGQIFVDGAVHYSADAGQLNLENVLGLAEITYILNPDHNFYFESRTRRVLERVRYLFISKQVLVIFYTKNITKERAREIEDRLSLMFNDKKEGKTVVFGFINIKENLEAEEISLPNLKDEVI